MPWPNIPSEPRAYYEFAQGADAFYKGQARPMIDPFAGRLFGFEKRDGWDWAERMASVTAKIEARNATRH